MHLRDNQLVFLFGQVGEVIVDRVFFVFLIIAHHFDQLVLQVAEVIARRLLLVQFGLEKLLIRLSWV